MTLQEYLTSLRHKTVAVIGIGVSNTQLLRRLLAAGLVLGLFAAALQLATADLAARLWLGDVRAVGALRVSALGMPWMAVS